MDDLSDRDDYQQVHVLQDMRVVITVVCGEETISSLRLEPDNELPNYDYNPSTNKSKLRETSSSVGHLKEDLHKGHELRIVPPSNKGSTRTGTFHKSTKARLCHTVSMDPMLASCLTTELQRSRKFEENFRLVFMTEVLQSSKGSSSRVCKHVHVSNDKEAVHDHGTVQVEQGTCTCSCIHLLLKLNNTVGYFQIEPDIRWSHRMLPQWIQRLQMEESFSWLSTLGGAYSSLGENIYICALEAGRVALRQLYLAECMGDPILKARCLLYVALSLMQRGKLSKAKRLVRQQFQFATSRLDCFDSRLVSMCRGIWHHLRHFYASRREK